jgi:murein hydrolase activator
MKLANSSVMKKLIAIGSQNCKTSRRTRRSEKRRSQTRGRLKKLANAKSNKQKKPNATTSADDHDTDNDASQNAGKVVAKNERLPEDDFNGVRFSSLKGRLRLPVRGDVSNRFGATRADTGVSWKGLFIKSSEGNEVKSVAGGMVVFADWMRGFGNLIIVDHGSGYMSLYGNNQALIKGVGERVNGGDTIASVGNSGGNESHGLYYELRRNSVPFDPLSWSRLH